MQCHLQHLCLELWYRSFGKTNSLSELSIVQNIFRLRLFHTPKFILERATSLYWS